MKLHIDRTRAYVTARLSGEIRSEDAQGFVDDLHPLVAQAKSKLAIDLADVSWLDSAGLTCLINVVTRSRLSGGRTILIGPTQFVAGVFEVTGLDKWFEIVDRHEEAAQRFSDGT